MSARRPASTGLWLVYVRRSYKKAGSDRVIASADTSDETQLARCMALLPPDAPFEVISDSGGHKSGRGDRRNGWQEVIRRVEAGGVAGIAAYDISRLARNARLVLNLHHAMEVTGADLKVAELPDARWTSAEGRFLLGQLALAAQFQGDYDSKRMTDMARATFEAGGHLGNDPFGYRTVRDDRGQVEKPRTLEIVEKEAVVVRRVFALAASQPFASVARQLQREGVRRRDETPWTRDAVKDIVRRGRMYLGFVVYRRGQDEVEGRHPPILDEAAWAATRKGITSRRSGASRASSRKRIYLLTGLIRCECEGRLHGQTRSSREQEWAYYLCRHCERKAIPASTADEAVLERLRAMLLPKQAVELARDELQRRLSLPLRTETDALRTRLLQRMERLKAQFEWGDVEEADYRRKMLDTRTELASLPEPEKILTFDRIAGIVASLEAAMASATPAQLRDLVRLIVDAVTTHGGHVANIKVKPAALPFFAPASEPFESIPAQSQGLGTETSDPIAWYAA